MLIPDANGLNLESVGTFKLSPKSPYVNFSEVDFDILQTFLYKIIA